jgi:hypothetical protein
VLAINANTLVGGKHLILQDTIEINGLWRQLTLSNMESISAPNLVSVTGGIQITGAVFLTSVSLPMYLPSNGTSVNFGTDALSAATVNHLLARCVANVAYVSGTVSLNGGTSAAPTGQGIIDKATLIGRGVTVNTN